MHLRVHLGLSTWEQQYVRKPFMNKDDSIHSLSLGNKPLKALAALGVKTVGEFLSLNINAVMTLPGMGRRTRDQLFAIQQRLLKDSKTNHNDGDTPATMTWANVFRELSVRTKNGLEALDIKTPEAFLALNRDQFLALRSIGVTCWREVKRGQKQLLAANALTTAKSGDPGTDAAKLLIAREVLGHRQHLIDDLSVHTIEELLLLQREDVTSLPGVGDVAWKKLQEAIHAALGLKVETSIAPEAITLENFPLFGGHGIGDTAIPDAFHAKAPSKDLPLSVRGQKVLARLGLMNLEEVLTAEPRQLMEQKNFGEHTLTLLRQSVRDYLDYQNSQYNKPVDVGGNFSEFLEMLCSASSQPRKRIAITLARVSAPSGNVRTYDDIAEEYGYTRERIRQILKKTGHQIAQHPQARDILQRFQRTADQVIRAMGGIVSLDAFCTLVSSDLGWSPTMPTSSLQELAKFGLLSQGIAAENDVVTFEHPCRSCDDAVRRLQELVLLSQDETMPLTNLLDPSLLCARRNGEGCPAPPPEGFFNPFLRELATRAGLVCNEDTIHSPQAWDLRYGGLNKKVAAALDLLGQAASPETVLREISPYLTKRVSTADVHSALIRSEDAVIWGRGVFIHRDYVYAAEEAVQYLREALLQRQSNGPFIALHGLFNELETELKESGIPNEYALSTVVGLYIPDHHVDRYRYVYADAPSEATRIDFHVEEWVLRQGGEVSRKELEIWLVKEIGGRKALAPTTLSRLDSIIATRKGYLIHIANTGLDQDALAPFAKDIQSYLEQHDRIGVGKLFRDQGVACAALGIVSERMLYSALRYFFSNSFDFERYPHIARQDAATSGSLREVISDYVKQEGGIVAIVNCVGHFEALGYSPHQTQVRLSSAPLVYSYYRGCVVHAETIGWDNERASQLHKALADAYEERRDLGLLTGDLDNVYELHEDRLPPLDNDLNWTAELLAALASKLEDVTMIGNAKRAYILTTLGPPKIALGSIVATVVRDIFGGGCSREQLDEWMQDNGVVRRHLTPRMFNAPPGLIMTDYECRWTGENDA